MTYTRSIQLIQIAVLGFATIYSLAGDLAIGIAGISIYLTGELLKEKHKETNAI